MIDASGDAFSFSTWLGGSSSDYAPGIAVVGTSLYVLGDTYSADFPTQNPLQPAHGLGENYDVFVARIEAPEPDAALLAIASIAAILCARAHRDRADQSHRR